MLQYHIRRLSICCSRGRGGPVRRGHHCDAVPPPTRIANLLFRRDGVGGVPGLEIQHGNYDILIPPTNLVLNILYFYLVQL